jgi:uncharacterized membrane protein
MIENIQALFTNPSFPSLHVVVVHLPIAFILLAPCLDLACLVLRGKAWLDRAATLLYVAGTIGAGTAYLTGERAAEGLAIIPAAAEPTLADHESLAGLTLAALAIVSLVRLLVSWLGRNDRRISVGFFRLISLPLALAGLILVALTAEHGGALVYEHGLGVQTEHTESSSRTP